MRQTRTKWNGIRTETIATSHKDGRDEGVGGGREAGIGREDVEKPVLIFDLLIRIAPLKHGIRMRKCRSE